MQRHRRQAQRHEGGQGFHDAGAVFDDDAEEHRRNRHRRDQQRVVNDARHQFGDDLQTGLEALTRAVAEARRRAGNLPVPVLVVGAGRGGKLGLEIAARTPGLFSGVGSVGGIFDPGPGGAQAVAGLRGVPVFLGVAKGAPPELYRSMQRGKENMEKLGVKLSWGEWPGVGEGLPANAAQAAKEILDVLAP